MRISRMTLDAVVHLIDDDDGVRQALAFMLTACGFPVRLSESGVALLDAIPALPPGCIVTDVRMPGNGRPGVATPTEEPAGFAAGDHHDWPRRRPARCSGDESGRVLFYRKALQR